MATKKKRDLSPAERKAIELLIKRRQKIKDQKNRLLTSRSKTVTTRDEGYHNAEDLVTVTKKTIDLCKRLGAVVPPKLTKTLQDEEKRRKGLDVELAILEKEELSVQKEIDIIYGVNSGKCPLCGHDAPCATTF